VTTTLLEVTDLAKGFVAPDGETTTIVDIPRFSLAAEEQVAVRGASGSGKTTFLNLIAGILRADRGAIVLDGQALTSLSESGRDRLRARTLGYVFQNFNLLQGYTALENVLLPLHFAGVSGHESRERAAALLDRVGLGSKKNNRPRALSVGEQQRVALARAVACRPSVLLADEPTANLDPENAVRALALLRDIATESGSTLVVVTHDDRVKAEFGRVLVLGGAA
jgi:ABC-type lipoprotein export system ATPase subunit